MTTEWQGLILYFIIMLQIMKHISKSYASENKISSRQESIKDFKRLCPYTDLCFSPANKNISLGDSYSSYPCCGLCYCEESCGNKCCPDKPEHFLNKSEVKKLQDAREQCVFAQIRPFSVSALNGKSYKMISKCPESYTDKNMAKKCLREYHEFDFGRGNFTTLIPVSSNVLDVTFKNIFCAICNGAVRLNLSFWDTKVECENEKKLSISHVSEIMQKLSKESYCQVMFVPSVTTPLEAVSICEDLIERCNVTGKWKIYDPFIETACHSYTSGYKHFKNIHCYLCNGHSKDDIDQLCLMQDPMGDQSSFIALIDFNDLERSSTKLGSITSSKCSSTSRFDPYQKVCRPLLCRRGMQLVKESCSPVYKAIDPTYLGTVFSLRFKLIPTKTARERTQNNLIAIAMTLYDGLHSKLFLMHTTIDLPRMCSFNTFLGLNSSLEDTILSMHRYNSTNFLPYVEFIAIIVDINVNGIKNSSETVQEMEMFFASSNYFAQYTIQHSIDDIEMPPNSKHNVIGEEYMSKLNELTLDHFQHEMIMNGQTDPETGLGVLTFMFEPLSPTQKCEPDFFIHPQPFCPLIKINHNETKIHFLIKKVNFLENEDLRSKVEPDFKFSNMLSSDQDGSVYVCSNEYFSQLPTLDAVDNGRFDELVILTIVCLSFSIISLVFTFTVYCLLPRLRTIPGLNNMALIFHHFFAHTLALTTAITEIKPSWLCSIVGVLLHFNLLSSFFWMFISTFHMMQAFVKIKEMSFSHHKMNKFRHHMIFTELLSAFLVISYIVVTILTEHDSEDFGYGGTNCYIKRSCMILYFVAIPLGLVITINLCIFSYVVWSVSRIPDMKHKSNNERHNLLIFAKLSTLTGITWVFGFFYQFTNVFLFAYFYIIFNAGQGVFIMISFINKRSLDMLFSRVYTNGITESISQSTKLTTVGKKEMHNTDTKF